MPFSRGSLRLRDRTQVSGVSCIGRQVVYHWATWETQCGFLSGWVLNPLTTVLVRNRREDTHMQKRPCGVSLIHWWEWYSPKPRNVQSHQELEEAREDSPSEPWEGAHPNLDFKRLVSRAVRLISIVQYVLISCGSHRKYTARTGLCEGPWLDALMTHHTGSFSWLFPQPLSSMSTAPVLSPNTLYDSPGVMSHSLTLLFPCLLPLLVLIVTHDSYHVILINVLIIPMPETQEILTKNIF